MGRASGALVECAGAGSPSDSLRREGGNLQPALQSIWPWGFPAEMRLLCVYGQALPTSPFPDPLRPFLNVTGSWGNIIANSHPDIVPEALVQALSELPFGPELNNAALALPTFTVSRPLPCKCTASRMHACMHMKHSSRPCLRLPRLPADLRRACCRAPGPVHAGSAHSP